MNILEHYIIDVINEEPFNIDVPTKKEGDTEYVKVTLTYDCYGNEKTDTLIFEREDWERAKAKGYFMQ